LAAEEMIASKLFIARRERFDGAEIAHVIYGTRGKVDWQRILTLVREHWEILFWALVLFRYVYPAQTNYAPAFRTQFLIRMRLLLSEEVWSTTNSLPLTSMSGVSTT
jgi:hypothetical protein